MNTFKVLTIINSLITLSLLVVAILYYLNSKEEKTETFVYVDNTILFNEFNMTKDIRTIEDNKIKAIKITMDSIYNLYKDLNKTTKKAKALELELNSKNQTLKLIQDNYTNNLSQKVWSRLNTYVSQYAKENNFKILFGTSGNGNIMYAREEINITSSILTFCNKKYEGN
ncbi:OmpH family outer membrane protein [uncultured Lacinutrix sp.]|uniref:OmpH family outer membrane protein n=1 Tax=uncultured Lacinutrix sp. TaxID=574032 RepID=UPI0026045075|nr:OmpH family outer membrane protein [uncultured Lacinutrix sp.]